jgi:hypothetical protein
VKGTMSRPNFSSSSNSEQTLAVNVAEILET